MGLRRRRRCVVNDYTGVAELIAHGYAEDGADAVRLALNAGLDMEMVSTHVVNHGTELLAQGRIAMDRVYDAVARILQVNYPVVNES
ncbi:MULTISPECIES: glycoside hydrolase family 3 N-terminal domain-containing protein [unclassified Streptomyces]|uniref:glycoside hydrolase family 3 N-terminal domain-containing protein n=1 Tax=unclassified Streptomyces TaxID=2593676 RepID=UPI002B1E4E7D|nr:MULTISPECIES: glycoside hydrolase family 3 N-terminal domain-containing protein [unclassified Streptomyces]